MARLIRENYNNQLTTLDLSNFSQLTTLPELPAFTQILLLHNCLSLTHLPESLPENLNILHLNNCRSLRRLPDALPVNLRTLELDNCGSLTYFPNNLPEDLQTLHVGAYPYLMEISSLPTSLRYFYLRGSPLIILPANLPPELRIIDQEIETQTQASYIYVDWLQRAGRTPRQIERFQQALEGLRQENHFTTFETFINRLRDDPIRYYVQPETVAQILEEVLRSPRTRTLILSETFDASQDCTDRISLIFNNVQYLAAASCLSHENANNPQALDQALLGLSDDTLRNAHLAHAALAVIRHRWSNNRDAGLDTSVKPNYNEALEVELALRHHLCEELGQAFRASIFYLRIANLNENDINFARNYMRQALADPQIRIEGLIAQPAWRNHLISQISEIEDINQTAMQKMVELDEAKETNSAEWYENRSNQLAQERKNVIDNLLRQRTQKIINSLSFRPLSEDL